MRRNGVLRETRNRQMEYKKLMERILTAKLPAKEQLRLMETAMELRRIQRDFANGVETLKDMLKLQNDAINSSLDSMAEKLEGGLK